MTRRKDFTKAITYTGQKLLGETTVTVKIDGCRALYRDGKIVSRNNKPYPGLEKACTAGAFNKIKELGDCEIYLTDFKTTTGLLQRHEPEPNSILREDIYALKELDERLYAVTVFNIQTDAVTELLNRALSSGYEGLVLRNRGRWYRVKPTNTADVRITGFFEQKDKHGNLKGILGGFTTNYGNVTAMTDSLRKAFFMRPTDYLGRLMEVSYKELYDTGSFRFGVKFERFRDDKDEESFDTRSLPSLRD